MLVSEDITATECAQARTTCHTNFACLEDVLAVPNFGTETSPNSSNSNSNQVMLSGQFNKTLVEASTTMLAFDKKLHTVKQNEADTRQTVLWLK
jgi:hypothetical protein